MPKEERAIVQCSSCGTPGAVVFEGGQIKKAFFPCTCPRPTVEEGNKEVLAKSHGVKSPPPASGQAK